MSNKATIIIPFFNEGDEIVKTVQSIYETANADIEIITIQDDDGLPEPVYSFPTPNLKYIRAPNRMGVDGCRNLGAMCAKHENLIILDAHMRFQNDNWCNALVEEVQVHPTSITTAVSKGVTDDKLDMTKRNGNDVAGRGCTILLKNLPTARVETKTDTPVGDKIETKININIDTNDQILSSKWDGKLLLNNETEVACIMGASYTLTKDFFHYLDGFTGLQVWGCSEALLSLKAWLFGGSCSNIPTVYAGHKYKAVRSASETIHEWHIQYNKMFIIYTLFPDKLVAPAIKELESVIKCPEARQLLHQNFTSIMGKRTQYQALLKHDIRWYAEKFGYELFA